MIGGRGGGYKGSRGWDWGVWWRSDSGVGGGGGVEVGFRGWYWGCVMEVGFRGLGGGGGVEVGGRFRTS